MEMFMKLIGSQSQLDLQWLVRFYFYLFPITSLSESSCLKKADRMKPMQNLMKVIIKSNKLEQPNKRLKTNFQKTQNYRLPKMKVK